MKFNNNEITKLYYSGHTIIRAYGCDGNLVFGEEPYTPPTYNFKAHADYNWGIPSEEVACDSSTTLTNDEVVSMPNIRTTMSGRYSDLIIGDCVETIASGAVQNINSITSVTIGQNVSTIERYAFADTNRITSITIPKNVETLGIWSFYHIYSAQTLTFEGNKITEIPQGCFEGMAIKELVLPSNIEVIGDDAFEDCLSLSSVTLSDNLTSIGNNAFRRCKISSVTIPSGVTIIGSGAFTEATLTVTMTSSTPPIVQRDSFPFNPNVLPYKLTIYVPSDAVNAYKKSNNWSYYKNVIQAIQ